MNKEIAAMFSLIKSALTGQKLLLNSNINWDKIIKIAKLHQIVPIIFYGLKNSNIATPYDDKLFEITTQNIFIEQRQFNIIEEVKNAFKKNNIDFLILKGARLKNIYPKSEMRVMGDIDILIRPEQYFEVRQIMLQMNFKEGLEWNYECHWRKNDINIELHKQFYSSNEYHIYDFFDNIWQKVKTQKNNKNSFEMSKEDEYIYIFLHLLKHYCAGGIGLRQFIDIYTYRLKFNRLDERYIENTLKESGFLDFHNNVIETLNYWFDGGVENQTVRTITQKAIVSCLFGTEESRDMLTVTRAIKNAGNVKKAKMKELNTMLFPSLSKMRSQYTVLTKVPFLLPVIWILRLVKVVFKPKNIKNNIKHLKKFDAKKVAEFDAGLKKVGL